MANEGSTKPTYSELEAENLRVRGLLQRHGGHLLECPAHPFRIQFGREVGACNCGWATSKSSGAESADIGKLDSAEEKCAYCKHTHTFQFDDIVDDDCPVVGCPCMHFLGSAETGGEKADWRERAIVALYSAKAAIGENFTGEPDGHAMLDAIDGTLQRLQPNFPRTSQNQTVSGGVEGAHEGTTADEKAMKAIYALREEMLDYSPSGTKRSPDSREPEKLNNAQNADELIDDLRLLLAGDFLTAKDRASARTVIANWLAESSLSSPPPDYAPSFCRHCNVRITFFGENAGWWHTPVIGSTIPQEAWRECFKQAGMRKAEP